MKLIQLFRLFFITVLIISYLYPKTVKPEGKEDMLKLVVQTDEGNKVRPYYLIDKDGLVYLDFNNFKIGDKVNFQVMSRTYMASNSNSSKKYQFELVVMDGNKELFSRDLSYKKKSSTVTSPEKNGFYFTFAGYWFEDIVITKKTKIILRPTVKGQKVYVRLLGHKVNESNKTDLLISPLDLQKKITVEYLKDDSIVKSKGWFLINKDNKQEFILESNSLVRILCRSIIKDKEDISNYSVKVYENSQWMGNYMFDEFLSENDAKVITSYKNLKDSSLSRARSFYISVPTNKTINYSYYMFSVDDESDDDLLIKIIEYENSNK